MITQVNGVPVRHRVVEAGDVSLHLVEAGSGPVVILIHGFPEFWYSWRHQIPALVDAGFRVIAPDLRGYNTSGKPHGVEAYKISAVAQDIASLAAQIGEVPCAIVAHDWGGVVAWFLAMLHPQVVRKLVILNAPHPVPFARELRRREQKIRSSYQLLFQPPRLPEIGMRLFRFAMLRWTLRRAARRPDNFDPAEMEIYLDAWRQQGALTGMANYYRAVRRYRRELRAVIRPIEIPAMLIWGEKDPIFTRATTENFSEYVPNLRIERIAEAGHFVQSDAPEKVNALLKAFL
ncbi:MAG TPA: alpha/beta hydrolase [Thermoanaerobaculia bacterium]|nr:alpha/beta hydrolase [Thermoanaerobaculia bacterium]